MPRRSIGIRLYLRKERRDNAGTITHHGVWVIRESGRPDVSTGFRASEREQADLRLAEYIAERYRAPRRERRLSEISIADVISIYASDVAPNRANPKRAGQELGRLLAFFGNHCLSDLNGRLCRAYAAKRGNDGGARKDLQTLSAAIQHHHREGFHTETIRVWLPPKGQPRDRWLTRSEIARLVWTAWRTRETQFGVATKKHRSKHIARAILFAYYTGSRIGDVLNASFYAASDRAVIDMDSGIFYRLPHGKRQTNKRRPSVRLGARIMAHLRRWKAKGAQFVVEYDGAPVALIKTGFNTACRSAGLEGVTPHTLRHSRATHLMQADVPDWEASGYLGMSQEIFRKTYAHHSPSAQKRAADAR
jgi:integrase